MNIIEAIKSGKMFRRNSKLNDWYLPNISEQRDISDITYGDVLADDWEVQEETIEITYEQFLKILRHITFNGPAEPTHLNDKIINTCWEKLYEISKRSFRFNVNPG